MKRYGGGSLPATKPHGGLCVPCYAGQHARCNGPVGVMVCGCTCEGAVASQQYQGRWPSSGDRPVATATGESNTYQKGNTEMANAPTTTTTRTRKAAAKKAPAKATAKKATPAAKTTEERVLATHCSVCGYEFPSPRARATCNSEAACARRVGIANGTIEATPAKAAAKKATPRKRSARKATATTSSPKGYGTVEHVEAMKAEAKAIREWKKAGSPDDARPATPLHDELGDTVVVALPVVEVTPDPKPSSRRTPRKSATARKSSPSKGGASA